LRPGEEICDGPCVKSLLHAGAEFTFHFATGQLVSSKFKVLSSRLGGHQN
jgi:hypothetical protein